jgi:hypothetical protein
LDVGIADTFVLVRMIDHGRLYCGGGSGRAE